VRETTEAGYPTGREHFAHSASILRFPSGRLEGERPNGSANGGQRAYVLPG
jgi:hypothetical protein